MALAECSIAVKFHDGIDMLMPSAILCSMPVAIDTMSAMPAEKYDVTCWMVRNVWDGGWRDGAS
jgi:hypothetical protein